MGDLSFAANSAGVRNVPPVLSSPMGTKTGTATATLACTSNMSGGTFYWYVCTSAAQPTYVALKAGTGATKFGSQTGATSNSVSVTGLSAATTYYVFFLHESPTYGIASYIASGGSFTTDAASSGNLTINITYDTNSQPGGSAFGGDATLQAAFYGAVQEAVASVEGWFCSTKALTIGLQFGYGSVNNGAINPGGLGQSVYNLGTYTMSQVKSALTSNAVTSVGTAAASNYPSAFPSRGGATPSLAVSQAHAKMLDLFTGTGVDGYVGIGPNGLSGYVFTRSGPSPTGSQYDAVGVIEHEIWENLGAFRENAANGDIHLYSPLDFMAYTAVGTHAYTLGSGVYFSYDGGTTVGRNFWTDSSGDAGDWDSAIVDARNAFASPGQFELISTVDKQLLDALGWQWTGN